jgi:hypothetical protein
VAKTGQALVSALSFNLETPLVADRPLALSAAANRCGCMS